MNNWRQFLLALALVMPAQSFAQDVGSADASGVDAVQALIDEFDAAREVYSKAMSAATTDAETSAARELYPSASSDYAPRMWELIDAHSGTEAALTALKWLARNDREPSGVTEVLGAIAGDFLQHEDIAEILQRAAVGKDSKGFVETIFEESPHDAVRANACIALAYYSKQLADVAEEIASGLDDSMRSYYTSLYGEEEMARLTKLGAEPLYAAAIERYELVITDFDEIKGRRGLLADSALGAVFEIRNLRVGMIPPDLEGEDIDGVIFKLSDYRGKVVVLDFWGDW